MYRALLPLLLLLLAPIAASAVIIDSGDGTGNTTTPTPDPGYWDHVGVTSGLTAVYLGDGCVLTASHVGMGDVDFGGVVYPAVPGSNVRITNGDGTFADLVVFGVAPAPPLGTLPISTASPPLGEFVIVAGNGRNRGAATSWDPNAHPSPPPAIGGYDWGGGKSLRWGTNFVEDYPEFQILDTWAMSTVFDAGSSAHEAQAANGDSGGALFWQNGSEWELGGLIYAISEFTGQPGQASLYGQLTHAADLAFYRDEILDVTCLPEPTGGLSAGLATLAALARARKRRPVRSDA